MLMMTSSLARSAAADLANTRMRKAGRTVWNRADFNAAAREYGRLMPAPDCRRVMTLSPLAERKLAEFEARMRA